ncbi:MAG TPA: GGDEF domain-containing protein [Arenimonas sp.]|uniref:GGDEF domain-containing protein n=1 Tax=Arenimonas sp. TaxID=1872635 RepID=UPI002C45F26A|nr:GGDEF domain-containing protein [Arenimonas sp.]HMB57545.1 GGDEF domain-containing protein [Arenimonas sp.]
MRALLQRLRTDFQLTIISSFGGAALFGILPFSFYRFATGNVVAGVLDMAIVLSILLAVAHAWRNEDRRAASLFVAIVNTVGCLASATVLGPPGLYWMYPALLGNFLLLSRGRAVLVTALAMLFLTIQHRAYDSSMQLAMFLVTAAVSGMVAFVFAYRTETQREQLEALATIDPLTGIQNRRAMERELKLAVELAGREGTAFALAMLDLDHFKRINDRYGHEAGDDVLVAFADLLCECTRKVDRCFRFGGEEFVLLMPGTKADALPAIDQQIRVHIVERLRSHGEVITVSIGAAALKPDEDWQSWLARADAALYRAKSEGRDRTVVDAAVAT